MAEEPIQQDQDNLDDLKKALAEAEEKAKTYLADAQRERADYQNLKKRTELEKQEYQLWANAEMMRLLLPVVDDMARAFNMVDPKFKDSTWVEGFRIIERNLQDILRSHDCAAIECVGQPFDPSFHEAIAYDEGEEGRVVSEHRKGYTLKDKVLRAAQVTVGNGNHAENKPKHHKAPDEQAAK